MVVMLIHHAWSAIYIGGPDNVRGVVSFVSSAFILYSGFLIGYILLNSYFSEPRIRFIRDISRGVKLMLVFILVNAVIYWLGYARISEDFSFFIWVLNCLSPNPPDRAVFSLLNAFAHFFAWSGVIIYVCVKLFSTRGEFFIRMSVVGASIVVALLSYYLLGLNRTSSSASAILYGYFGLSLGIVLSLLQDCYIRVLKVFGSVALAVYLVLSVLTLTGNFKPYQYYIPFVLLGSAAVWKISELVINNFNGKLARSLAFLGSYTLISYMIQVVISKFSDLKIIDYYYFSSNIWLAFLQSVFVMAFVMIVLIKIIDFLRIRSAWFDASYRMIFA